MNFDQFQKELSDHITMNMLFGKNHIFQTNMNSDELYNIYLDSFPPGTNEIYRQRREYDCNICRHFIKRFGTLVTLSVSGDGSISKVSCWDFEPSDPRFGQVVKALASAIDSSIIVDVLVTKESKFGTIQSVDNYESKIWKHLNFSLPAKFVYKGSKSTGDIRGDLRTNKEVFQRTMKEISLDAINSVLELINSNTLYKGAEWKNQLQMLGEFHSVYHRIFSEEEQELYCWIVSLENGPVISKIKNHSIGVLLTDISEGMDLDAAVTRYEKIVAPTNYKRPKAIFTKKMIEQAEKTLIELGYADSLARRRAKLDDISVADILFANKDAQKRLKGSVFDELKNDVPKKPSDFGKVTEISIEKFISDVLPSARTLEILFEGKHIQNLVSIIAPANKDAKSMLKWNNNFSWAYKGNITDSTKELVKAAGGDVTGDLRFSIRWNDDGKNRNDYDAHAIEPNKYEIYYRNRSTTSRNSGRLDVDIIYPNIDQVAVENITYKTRNLMQPGQYHFFVDTFSNRGGENGFSAEIEFDGQLFEFNFPFPAKRQVIAVITLDTNKQFSIQTSNKTVTGSRKVWNIDTNTFIPVTLVMNSPNYWNGNDSTGHKHYIFMLANCISDETPNGFFNEFLDQRLNDHRKVFEALGSKMKVENVEDQLSGIGFSSTKRAELICRVTGSVSQTLKIKF